MGSNIFDKRMNELGISLTDEMRGQFLPVLRSTMRFMKNIFWTALP